MRRTRIALAALLLAPILTGCTSDVTTASASNEQSTPTPSPSTEPASAETPTDTGETIPEGTYVKTVTGADAQALDIKDEAFLRRELGKDGKVTYTYRFAGDRWTQFGTYNGVPDVGDLGTLAYDGGKVTLTSESDGCPGCVYIYNWQLDGTQLSMTLVGHDSNDGPEELLVVRFVTEGTYLRQR